MSLDEFVAEWESASPHLVVHTSGSTGRPKPILVEKSRMEASARMTCTFLGLHQGDNALLCLPLDYIAGKMMVVRARCCGMHLLAVTPSGHPLATPYAFADRIIHLAAMVPLQVWNALQVPQERKRLMGIRHLLIGGGPVDPRLADELKDFPHAVWSTYGMTETLSHVALRRLNGPGRSPWYTPLPGVKVSLNSERCLVVDAPHVCQTPQTTRDIAEMDGQQFRILGRLDNVVCSGGRKIQIETVEEFLSAHLDAPFMLTSRPDERLGQALVLLTEGDTEKAAQTCRQVLSKYDVPRIFKHVEKLPQTPNGKPDRTEAAKMALITS